MPSVVEQIRSESPLLTVGILSADMMNLGRDVATMEEAGVKMLHFDVMDGVFCPGFTVGPGFVKSVKTSLLKDVHLMVNDPLEKLDAFVAAGADLVTVHVESTIHAHRALQALGQMTNANDPERGIARGIALNPGTPVEAVRPLLDDVDLITLLAVNPGWGGQSFIEPVLKKLDALQRMVVGEGSSAMVCIDGGIKKDNIASIAEHNVDVIITGSAVFKGDPKTNAEEMIRRINGK